ncbi:glycosyltransferase family 2 protein [Candidatus Uhrbacteria bacterium]|nr:glycosyltransferase family 2 protein [Candidatus Uhrbacteria bacterium]
MPTISLIIPAYQHARTLPRCLENLLAQTRRPEEIIVVDDGSTDGTSEILRPYAVKVNIIRQENRGSNRARMNGFAASMGDLICFCDADALFVPDALETLETALQEHPEASYAYSGFRFGWKRFPSYPFDPTRLREMNYVHTSALIRRDHFPGFDPTIRRLQDWDLWLTMLEQGHRGIFVPRELFKIIDGHGRKGISQWQPSFLYKIPWRRIGWMPRSIREYEEAREVVRRKHKI